MKWWCRWMRTPYLYRFLFFFFFLSFSCFFLSLFFLLPLLKRSFWTFFCPFVLRLTHSLDSFSFSFPFWNHFRPLWFFFFFSSGFLSILVYGARCDNTPRRPTPLYQLPLSLMAIRSDRLVVSLIFDQGHYTFLYRCAKHNREGGGKMNKRTNTDLG